MNAKDRADLERFARKLAAEELKARPAPPARAGEARLVTVTPADPLERT